VVDVASELAMVRIRDFLLLHTSLTSVVGQRIYASRELPPEYHPDPSENDPEKTDKGPGILFWIRGGPRDYTRRIQECDVWFECYALDEITAQTLAEITLFDILDCKKGQYILFAHQDIEPQITRSPDTDWNMSVVPYTIRVRNL
jgi:hypothetical protein